MALVHVMPEDGIERAGYMSSSGTIHQVSVRLAGSILLHKGEFSGQLLLAGMRKDVFCAYRGRALTISHQLHTISRTFRSSVIAWR